MLANLLTNQITNLPVAQLVQAQPIGGLSADTLEVKGI
jgi:hypothetical protein